MPASFTFFLFLALVSPLCCYFDYHKIHSRAQTEKQTIFNDSYGIRVAFHAHFSLARTRAPSSANAPSPVSVPPPAGNGNGNGNGNAINLILFMRTFPKSKEFPSRDKTKESAIGVRGGHNT